MNRRDFLRPQQLLRGTGQIAGFLEEVSANRDDTPPPESTLLRCSRSAMATSFEILLPFGVDNGTAAAEDALNEIDRLEAQLTVYRDSSEVSQLNRSAALRPMRVEPRLFQLLQLAEELHRSSQGVFDISVGALIKAWGFYRRRGCVPSPQERDEMMTRSGMQHVRLEPETQSVAYLRRGLEINLGSIGKGYALDRAVELLVRQWGIAHALTHGGHSSVVALGSQPGSRRGWSVGIRHPETPQRQLAVVWLRDRAMGTSAATFQHLEHEGRKLGHLLDPRTGWPAEGMRSATATAPTGALADALATVFYILGVDKAREYCEQNPEIGAVLLPAEAERPIVLGYARNEVDPSINPSLAEAGAR